MNKLLRKSVPLLIFVMLAWPVAGVHANGEILIDDEIVDLYAKGAILELCQRSPSVRCEVAKRTIERVDSEKYFFAPKGSSRGQQILSIYSEDDDPYFPYVVLSFDKDGLLLIRSRGIFIASQRQQLIEGFLESGDFAE